MMIEKFMQFGEWKERILFWLYKEDYTITFYKLEQEDLKYFIEIKVTEDDK